MADTPRYDSPLTGAQVDAALLDMAEHNSEAYAVGKRAGSDVPSTDPTYHNNAKYYAELAESVIPGEYTDAVRFDIDQTELKTDAEKAQARANIDSAPNSVVEPLINIWDEQWELGLYDTATGQPSSAITCIRSKADSFIPVNPNTQYYQKSASSSMIVFWYDAHKGYISYSEQLSGVITSPSNARYMRFRMSAGYGTTYNNDISINYPSNYTGYYPAKVSKVDMPWADLLWENASPSSAFAQQTVNLDLKNYNFLYILFRRYASNANQLMWMTARKGTSNQVMGILSNKICYRAIGNIDDNGLLFYTGNTMSSYGTSSEDANYCVPYRIYGIR